jgi:hypothetical protein
MLGHVDLGHRQAFDVVAAPGEKADDPRQDTRLVVDQHGEYPLFDLPRHAFPLKPGTLGPPGILNCRTTAL